MAVVCLALILIGRTANFLPVKYANLHGVDLSGKLVVVTGANTGIGKETAKALAGAGARVALACRSLERGQAAAMDIVAATGNPGVDVFRLDLASLASVAECAEALQAWATEHSASGAIDVLVNNAGLNLGFGATRQETADGLELTFGVNHVGVFHLTNLLLNCLRRSTGVESNGGGNGRVVILSSDLHARGSLDLDDLAHNNGFSGFGAYCRSKLCNVLHGQELARRVGGEVNVYVVHPGMVDTDLARHSGGVGQAAWKHILARRTAFEGAQTSVWCSVAATTEATPEGAYFFNCTPEATGGQSNQDGLARRLWEATEAIIAATA